MATIYFARCIHIRVVSLNILFKLRQINNILDIGNRYSLHYVIGVTHSNIEVHTVHVKTVNMSERP